MPNRRDFLTAATLAGVETLLPARSEAQPSATPAEPSVPGQAPSSNGHTDFVLSTRSDPYELFETWRQEAKTAKDPNAAAMTLCTVDASGIPDGRMMLHQGVVQGEFLFSSFANSAKGQELRKAPKAALVYYWTTSGRQVRVRGGVRQASASEVGPLWDSHRQGRANRLRDLAWPQSQPFQSAEALERKLKVVADRYPNDVPRGDWTAWFLTPISIEVFYPHPVTSLHERLLYSRAGPNRPWTIQRVVP